jgi:very-short-patch-repair endonuclease
VAALRGRRLHSAKFRRQVPLDGYVVDFFCFDSKLVIELDGKQHAWEREYDEERTRALEAMGLAVLRFGNDEVREDIDSVLMRIAVALRPASA